MSDSDVGIYVHVPFCERICPYCDFAVVAARALEERVEAQYVDALLRELAGRRGAFADRRLASLYLGGGTPSLLRPESIGRIVRAGRDAFPGSGEITLEINPSSVERARLPGFREAGVNRVSVGVQSFDDETLHRLGRAHRAKDARLTLSACREAGFEAISIDLIVAAPRQTQAGVERDVDAAIEFGPDHVSVYELTVEAGTPFALAEARGQLRRAGEEEAIRMHARVESRLARAGYTRYEISNYARPGREAVHNRRYWERRPVLGIGVSAVSNDPATLQHPFGVRRSNPRDASAWLACVAGGRAAEVEILSAAAARAEAIFLALRTVRGLEAAPFAREFGAPPRAFFAQSIDRLLAAALLSESRHGNLRLTPRGRLLADSVSEHFV
ncbi:MAG: radical SAM family heme chaperone HemW [Myxococcales bacterium]|nr:radical SAM family heme chaperone HemW [Myxococcales bacterium]